MSQARIGAPSFLRAHRDDAGQKFIHNREFDDMQGLNAVLIDGSITADSLKRATEEIVEVGRRGEQFSLLINSLGGDLQRTLDFVDFLTSDENLHGLQCIRIYQSGSAASYLALSLNVPREMRWNSAFGLHLGSIGRVEIIDLEDEGRIREESFARFIGYFDKLMSLVLRLGVLTREEIRDTLIRYGQFELPAKECLRRGFVHRLF